MKEMDPGSPKARGTREYRTPELRRVRLVPDEAVLASCKTHNSSGPTGLNGRCIGSPSTCFMHAS